MGIEDWKAAKAIAQSQVIVAIDEVQVKTRAFWPAGRWRKNAELTKPKKKNWVQTPNTIPLSNPTRPHQDAMVLQLNRSEEKSHFSSNTPLHIILAEY